MKRIPTATAQRIAEYYGYDQVMIYARKVDRPAGVGETASDAIKGDEYMTTYGVDRKHCDTIARIASFLQTKIMGWTKENT